MGVLWLCNYNMWKNTIHSDQNAYSTRCMTCTCICICMYMYIYTHYSIYIYVCICIYIYVYIITYTYMYVYVYTYNVYDIFPVFSRESPMKSRMGRRFGYSYL